MSLSCFQQSSGVFLVGVLAPEEMTEDKAMKKIWSKFQKQLGVFSVTLSESSSCKKLQNSRSSSPPSAGSCVQPSPAGPFFCLVLVVPSLIWRKNVSVSAPQDFTALKVLQTSRVQIMTVSSREEN